jgi:hypothetical protein
MRRRHGPRNVIPALVAIGVVAALAAGFALVPGYNGSSDGPNIELAFAAVVVVLAAVAAIASWTPKLNDRSQNEGLDDPGASRTRPTRRQWQEIAHWQRRRIERLQSDLLRDTSAGGDHGADLVCIQLDTRKAPKGRWRRFRDWLRLDSPECTLEAEWRLGGHRVVFLVGDSGAGKSVALCGLALGQLARAERSVFSLRPIPLYVSLAELNLDVAREPTAADIRAHVLRQAASLNGAEQPEIGELLDQSFAWGLERGKWLFLIDGFDDTRALLDSRARDALLDQYLGAIVSATTGSGRCRMLVAARPSPRLHAAARAHPRWDLEPLSIPQRQQVLDCWFPSPDEQARVKAQLHEHRAAFAEHLGNPLKLAVVASFLTEANHLADSLRGVFSGFARVRLERAAKASDGAWPAASLTDAAGCIALRILADQSRGIMRDLPGLVAAVPEARGRLGTGPQDALARLHDARLGCIEDRDRTGKHFRFHHRPLLEHFAILGLRRRSEPLPMDVDDPARDPVSLTELLWSETWQEVAIGLLEPETDMDDQGQAGICARQFRDAVRRKLNDWVDAHCAETLSMPHPADLAEALRGECETASASIDATFAWPHGAYHLLSTLHCAGERDAPRDPVIDAAVDRLLVTACEHGDEQVRYQAISVLRAASEDGQRVLLTAGIGTRQGLFVKPCVDQALRRPPLQQALIPHIREALVARWVVGAHPDGGNAAMRERLLRLDPQGGLDAVFQLLTAIGPVDRLLYRATVVYLLLMPGLQFLLTGHPEYIEAWFFAVVVALSTMLLLAGVVGTPRRIDDFPCRKSSPWSCLTKTWMLARVPVRIIVAALVLAVPLSALLPQSDGFVGRFLLDPAWRTAGPLEHVIESVVVAGAVASAVPDAFAPAALLAILGLSWTLLAPVAAMSGLLVRPRWLWWPLWPCLPVMLLVRAAKDLWGPECRTVRPKGLWAFIKRTVPNVSMLAFLRWLATTIMLSGLVLLAASLLLDVVAVHEGLDLSLWQQPTLWTFLVLGIPLLLLRIHWTVCRYRMGVRFSRQEIDVKALVYVCSRRPPLIGEHLAWRMLQRIRDDRTASANPMGRRFLEQVIEAVRRDRRQTRANARDWMRDWSASSGRGQLRWLPMRLWSHLRRPRPGPEAHWEPDVAEWHRRYARRGSGVAYLSGDIYEALVELQALLERQCRSAERLNREAVVIRDSIALREAPSRTGRQRGLLSKGQRVWVKGNAEWKGDDVWVEVETTGQRVGYVLEKSLRYEPGCGAGVDKSRHGAPSPHRSPGG